MKITRGKARGVVVKLGRADTKLWEDAGPDGVEFRAKVRKDAQDFASGKSDLQGQTIEIYASESEGGWLADAIEVDEP
jgi:hypothetical protein